MKQEIKEYPIPTKCIYCGAAVIFTSNAAVYGREYGNGKCYKCVNCDAFVGVHTGTNIPLGILADKELRGLKKKCHALFDPAWQDENNITRGQAYRILAKKLNIPADQCHFGWFDKKTLEKCVKVMENKEWFKTNSGG